MQVTAQVVEKILKAMKARGLSQLVLAEKIGRSRSYVSKLLKGDFATIPDRMAHTLSDALEVSLMPLKFKQGAVSSTALQLTQMAEEDAAFSSVLEALVALKGGDAKKAFLPSVSTEALKAIGAEVSRIVHEWEQPKGDYTPKIGAEVLSFLREFYQKGEF